jgi:hypothetical protein
MAFFYLAIFNNAFASNNQITIIPRYNMEIFNQKITNIYTNPIAHSKDIKKRIKADSQHFIYKSYLNGALGEGPKALFDKSPLYRTDMFDCTTFASTVLALVESNNLIEFKKNILKVRYKNNAALFINRNHFISVDWNINNEKQGFLKDINSKILDEKGNPIAVTANAFIDKPNWYKHLRASTIKSFYAMPKEKVKILYKALHDCSYKVKPQASKILYLPFSKLFTNGAPNQQLFDQIPSATVIEIVRPNWNLKDIIGTNINISHMGFGIRIKGKLIFREASFVDKKVEDVDLEKYLAQYLNSSTIKGIRVEKIVLQHR